MMILGGIGAFIAFVLVVAQLSVNEVLDNQNKSRDRQFELIGLLQEQNKEMKQLEEENRKLNLKLDCVIALHVQEPNGLVSPEELEECRLAADGSQDTVDRLVVPNPEPNMNPSQGIRGPAGKPGKNGNPNPPINQGLLPDDIPVLGVL